MKNLNIKGVSVQTWVRTLILIVALINQGLVTIGISNEDLDYDSWVSVCTYILTAITSIWSWWKNNSFTSKAQDADKAFNLKP